MSDIQELRKRLEKHMDVLCNRIGERHLGSEGEKKAVEYIESQFKSFGYEVIKEEYDAPGWKYGEYSFSIVETGQSLPCFPCFYSNSCDVEGKLKIIDTGDINVKVKGEICFYIEATEVGGVGGRNKLAEKLDKMGASVLIVISNYQDTENTKIIRTPRLKHLAVMTVSGDTALEIARNLHQSFKIKIEAENFTVKSANVVARVKGNANKKVVIGAHYDTAPGISGAADDASGTVVLIELARLLRSKNKGYSIDFVAFGGEEYGDAGGKYPLGSYEYAKQHKKELKQISWMWNIDDLGALLSRSSIHIAKSQKIKKFIKKTVTDIPIKGLYGGGDDKIFNDNGIPTVWLNSESQYTQIHSPKDNISKISFDKLSKMSKTVFQLLEGLLSMEGIDREVR